MATAVLMGLLLWGVSAVYQDRDARHRHLAERELQAINRLQTQSVTDWRVQRMTDAATLSDDALLAGLAEQWLATQSPRLREQLVERLRTVQERSRYTALFLVDTDGTVLLEPNGDATGLIPDPEQDALAEALQRAEPSLIEPRRAPRFAYPFASLIAPLFNGTRPVGAVWLVMDVRTTLFPLLEPWPTPSETAEASIVRRDDNEVVFLSPLRHRNGSALDFRLPLGASADPAAQAAEGVRGLVYGSDYRGHPVMAMVSAVPDSSWFVISKIDVAEVLSDVQTREILALSLPVSLGLLLTVAVLVLWQRRAWRRERSLKKELERNMRWLEEAQKVAFLGYFAYHVEAKRFTMSRMANRIFGLPAEGDMSLAQWLAMIHPEDRTAVLEQHRTAMEQRSALRQQYRIHRRSDQQLRWVAVWGEYEVDGTTNSPARMIGTVQDITERKAAEQALADYRAALEEQVRRDPLTGLANRRALDETVAVEWHRAIRAQAPLSLLMLDVDHFKAYNDHYGHVAGDECLQRVAQVLAQTTNRVGDLAARYGGEEFAVLLPGADAEGALQVAQRICEAVRDLEIAHAHSSAAPVVTVSVGVASLQPMFAGLTLNALPLPATGASGSGIQVAQLLFQRADTALYRAKEQGRDRAVVYSEPPAQEGR